MEDDQDQNPSSTMTVFDRLVSAGLSAERIAWWLAQEAGSVRVDDEPVTDGSYPAPRPAHVTLRG